MHIQTPDSKKEEYRRYLEKSGVTDALTKGKQLHFCLFVNNHLLLSKIPLSLTSLLAWLRNITDMNTKTNIYTTLDELILKVLVGLYEEPDRPSNAIDYIKKYLGAPASVDVDALRAENEEMKAKIKDLSRNVEDLNIKLREATGRDKKAEV